MFPPLHTWFGTVGSQQDVKSRHCAGHARLALKGGLQVLLVGMTGPGVGWAPGRGRDHEVRLKPG